MRFMLSLPPEAVLNAYGLNPSDITISVLGNGLINHTWKLASSNKSWVLQKINEAVFVDPDAIAHNIGKIGAFLEKEYPSYLFTKPVESITGTQMVRCNEGCFRLFPFIPGSVTLTVVNSPEQAYEAARQFGLFTACLRDFDISGLETTLADFHNLELRYHQFQESLVQGIQERITANQDDINFLLAHEYIVAQYAAICKDKAFTLRVTHHDTKISNVLFNNSGKGYCVIDLDTVMPGYFTSDAGDMFRTYLSPVNEEETNLALIEVREEIYKAIVDGYCSAMQPYLTEQECKAFYFAGLMMIYMQALRFMTDYLNGDKYYAITYPEQNLNRAKNQLALMERYLEKKEQLEHYLPTLL